MSYRQSPKQFGQDFLHGLLGSRAITLSLGRNSLSSWGKKDNNGLGEHGLLLFTMGKCSVAGMRAENQVQTSQTWRDREQKV